MQQQQHQKVVFSPLSSYIPIIFRSVFSIFVANFFLFVSISCEDYSDNAFQWVNKFRNGPIYTLWRVAVLSHLVIFMALLHAKNTPPIQIHPRLQSPPILFDSAGLPQIPTTSVSITNR